MAEKIDFPGCGCFLGTGSGLIHIIHKIIGAVPVIIPHKQKAEKCYQCSKYTAFDTESAPVEYIVPGKMSGYDTGNVKAANRHSVDNSLKYIPRKMITNTHPYIAGFNKHI